MADPKVSPVDALSPASRAWGEIPPHSAHPRWGMAVDQERETEAQDWCNALAKDMADEAR